MSSEVIIGRVFIYKDWRIYVALMESKRKCQDTSNRRVNWNVKATYVYWSSDSQDQPNQPLENSNFLFLTKTKTVCKAKREDPHRETIQKSLNKAKQSTSFIKYKEITTNKTTHLKYLTYQAIYVLKTNRYLQLSLSPSLSSILSLSLNGTLFP